MSNYELEARCVRLRDQVGAYRTLAAMLKTQDNKQFRSVIYCLQTMSESEIEKEATPPERQKDGENT